MDFRPAASEVDAFIFMETRVIEPPENIQQSIVASGVHSEDSSLREQALVHLFLGELLAEMWRTNRRDIEVLKAEVDRGGYDLVLEANPFRSPRPAEIELCRLQGPARQCRDQTAGQARRMRGLA